MVGKMINMLLAKLLQLKQDPGTTQFDIKAYTCIDRTKDYI